MADRRGPVYPQGSPGPESFTVTAKDAGGRVVAVARGVLGEAAADKLAQRWLSTPALRAVAASATEEA